MDGRMLDRTCATSFVKSVLTASKTELCPAVTSSGLMGPRRWNKMRPANIFSQKPPALVLTAPEYAGLLRAAFMDVRSLVSIFNN